MTLFLYCQALLVFILLLYKCEHIIPQVPGILQSTVPGGAVGHKPRDLLGLVGGVVDCLVEGPHTRVVVLPPLIRRHNSRVRSVGGGPVEN